MQNSTDNLPFLSYSNHLVEKYGYRIWRVGVDAGFSCPNRGSLRTNGGCVYCDSQGATAAYQRIKESSFNRKSSFEENIDENQDSSNGKQASGLTVKQQIEKGREFLTRRYNAEHFALYLQSFSNTFAPVEKLKDIYTQALSGYDWDQFIVSTRPDCLDEEKVILLKSFQTEKREVCVEMGLQSGDDEILKAMNRGHSVQQFIDAAELVKKYGLPLCVHILIGFPGEGQEQLQKTVDVINLVHPQAIKIHNLNICAGTKLYNMFLEGKAKAPDVEECISKTITILRQIPQDVVVERLLCETPSHRLASPRNFPDKNTYTKLLIEKMKSINAVQGDMHEEKK